MMKTFSEFIKNKLFRVHKKHSPTQLEIDLEKKKKEKERQEEDEFLKEVMKNEGIEDNQPTKFIN